MLGKLLKIFLVSLIFVLVVSTIAGCAKPAPAPAPTPAPPPPAPKPAPPPAPDWTKEPIQEHVIAWSMEGGTSQTMVTGIADVVNRNSDMHLEVTLLTGTKAIPKALTEGKADYWYYTPASTYDIYLGRHGMEPKVKCRTLMMGDKQTLAVRGMWVRADSDIKTEADLGGKRIAHFPHIGWTKVMPESMVKAGGNPVDSIKLVPCTGGGEAGKMLTEKTVDAICFVAGSATVELQKTIGLHMVPMSQEAFDFMVQEYPGHELGISPKGWYGTPEDTQTAVTYGGVWIRHGVNDITVYTMMKTLFEHIDEFHLVHAKAKGYNVATAASGFEMTTPFHSGVIRYYKEMGVWGPKEDEAQKKLLDKENEIYGK